MLNIFPIQFLALLAYALLRVCVGLLLIRFGIAHFKNRSSLILLLNLPYFPFPRFALIYISIVETLIGLFLIAGYGTQIAALLAMLLSLKCIVMHKHLPHPAFESRAFYTLLLFASLSLFITGAGAFAFDLPI